MNLVQAIERISEHDSESTIWISSSGAWKTTSEVVVAEEGENGEIPTVAQGKFEYLLEIFIASEIIANMPNNTLEEKASRIIEYAINDA